MSINAHGDFFFFYTPNEENLSGDDRILHLRCLYPSCCRLSVSKCQNSSDFPWVSPEKRAALLSAVGALCYEEICVVTERPHSWLPGVCDARDIASFVLGVYLSG